jgi:hypothetical protein
VLLRRPERIFGLLALLIAAAAAWLFIDFPRDSGARLRGTVVYCKSYVGSYETPPTACLIALNGQNRQVQVYMTPQPPGHGVNLIELRAAITGRRHYAVDYTSRPERSLGGSH